MAQLHNQQSSSRLNRLLTLLDTGSTQATRFAAARQIGDIAKTHPNELNALLNKVSKYLRSRNWDTRVAAAHAIGAIAEKSKRTSLSDLYSSLEKKISEAGISFSVEELCPKDVSCVSFRSFDITKVLDFGALLASGGQEYDISADNTKNSKERLARQKRNLKKRLGLDVCEKFMDVDDMIRDEDLVHNFDTQGSKMIQGFRSKRPSARELNLLKRKAKVKDHVVKDMEISGPQSLGSEKAQPADIDTKSALDSPMGDDIREHEGDGRFPFDCFIEQLILDMFDPAWEVRHGSVMALREILTYQGAYIGVCPPEMASPCHQLSRDLSDEYELPVKREREIDPTPEVSEDGSVLDPKRPKLEAIALGSFPVSRNLEHNGFVFPSVQVSSGADVGSAFLSVQGHRGADVRAAFPTVQVNCVADVGSAFSAVQFNGIADVGCACASVQVTSAADVGSASPSVQVNSTADAGSAFPSIQANSTDVGSALPSMPVNTVADVDSVVIKTETCLDGGKSMCGEGLDAVVSVQLCEDKASAGGVGVLKNSGNVELMNFVNLTQNSWRKNSGFLQDCAIRFLCVLSLDRFGDYVSDQVVAPVRETCAQALGAVLKYMAPELVHQTLNILLQMQNRPEWEIRHGGLLGIKYLVAVRREMLSDLLGFVLPACKAGLEDPDDDVRAVAADALIPAASAIVSLQGHTLRTIVMLLWDILLDLDDLSPSTSSVMNLLSEIYSHDDMILNILDARQGQDLDLNEISLLEDHLAESASEENPCMLSVLAPRLWPFMRHIITTVRYSAIRTLERLLEAAYRRHISDCASGSFWPSFILADTLRIVFQNMLLESNEDILQCTERVWRLLLCCPIKDLEAAAAPFISSWLELATTPYGSALDTAKMFWPVGTPRKSHVKAAAKMRTMVPENDAFRSMRMDGSRGTGTEESSGQASATVKLVVGADFEKSVTQTRVVATAALGILASKWPVESLKCFMDPLWSNLISTSGVQRQVASMIIVSWFKEMKNLELSGSNVAYPALAEHFKSWLLDLLSCTDPSRPTKDTSLPYSELSRTYSKMQSEASHLFRAVESSGHFKDMLSIIDADLESIGVDDAINFASKIVAPGTDGNGERPAVKHVFDELESLRQRLLTTAGYLKCVQNNLHVTVSALVAAAVVWMSGLPARLNPIILPLMASVKREQEEILQDKSAEALAKLIHDCISRKPGPNEKLIKNICSCTCMDPSETPQAGVINSMEVIDEQDLLSLKGMTGNQKSRTRSCAGGEDRSKVEGFVSRRGAELALKHLCERFGAFLFDKVPKLWECLTEVLKPVNVEVDSNQERQIRMVIESINDPQVLINNLQVVRSVAPLLDDLLKPKLLALLPCIFKCVCYHHVAVRLAASRCIASMAKCMTVSVMAAVVENAIPMLRDIESVPARQGAGMLISLLVQGLGMELVPYAPLLVVPLLRCMSDSDPSVRQTVTRSFAALVPLLPLARGVPPPVGLSETIVKDKEDAQFLEQLLDNSSIEDYKLSTELKVTLRRYQQEGINWLAFLRRFKLHGILCDDMGLGKTLQASAIVASDIAERHAANKCETVPPSLIVCPSTLVGHWAFEIEKYIDPSVINTLQYFGSTPERISLRSYFDQYRVIITSYDVVRKDVDYLGQLSWNYCILDEGHVIKNARSKITAAVKQLKAQHRLILSGTPIQNNILDLWSLFDFLMPGFLGSERQFQAAYGKPLVAARDTKCSKKDAEAGVLAMEALHKQVMPFLLRRTKDEVLSDLPEKIIQDRYCDLSPVQLKLYEQFSGVHVKKEISSLVGVNEPPGPKTTNGGPKETSHVFQALQYLLKLCSHPLLVVTEKIVDSLRSMTSELFPDSSHVMSELHNLHHSPKLVALQEILEECGIGVDASNSDGIGNVGQHRVLIFAQHKAFLDLIERDLFQTHMKSVTYLRLDGSVDANSRFNIAQAFNSDPTIDVLMLTTHSGGVGLNLTSADTLIFVEHDWNPMRDLQAMDRAHRLGQKKVVNVHRLIMRGTLEEKVMSLQRFKVSVANAVINSENASLKTMNTDQLLDLFTPDSRKKAAASISLNSDGSSSQNQRAGGGGKGLKAVLSSLEELWDPSQYSNEYNLKQFLDKLERS